MVAVIEPFKLFFTASQVGFWYALVLGCMVGSFLNVVIHRMPTALFGKKTDQSPWFSLFSPGSTTPCCQKTIPWYDNLPLVSWLRLRGKCRYCANPISARYLLVELVTGLSFAWAYSHFGSSWATLFYCAHFALLITLFCIDLETYYLPDCFTYSVSWLGLSGSALGVLPLLPESAVIGAAVGYLLPWSINLIYWLWRRRDGFGGGDFKLLAALGAWLGATAIIPILGLASILALMGVGLQMFLSKEKLNLERMLPFGPFLILAAMVFLLNENLIRYITI